MQRNTGKQILFTRRYEMRKVQKTLIFVFVLLFVCGVIYGQDRNYDQALISMVREVFPDGEIIAISPSGDKAIALAEGTSPGEVGHQKEGRLFLAQQTPRYKSPLTSYEVRMEIVNAQLHAASTAETFVENLVEQVLIHKYSEGYAENDAVVESVSSLYTAWCVENLQLEMMIRFSVRTETGYQHAARIFFSFPKPDYDAIIAKLENELSDDQKDKRVVHNDGKGGKSSAGNSLHAYVYDVLYNNKNLQEMRNRRKMLLE